MDTMDSLERNPAVELALFAVIALLMLADLASDAGTGGNGTLHVVLEGLIMVAAGAGVLRLWGAALAARRDAQALSGQLAEAQAHARHWEVEAHDALAGMTAAIERQLSTWGLTPAEQEVGVRLLRGQSHKEIAADRRTSERTVRQQALAVYRKSGVRSRAELAAFFLRGLPLREQ